MKDLCKPCRQDSDCDNETSCSVAAQFPDSPLDRYCVPRDLPTFSCLKSSDGIDYLKTVGVPGADTPHYLMPAHFDDYLSCASSCFKPQDTDGHLYPVSIFLKKHPDAALEKQLDLFGLSAGGSNCLCLGMVDTAKMDYDKVPASLHGKDRGYCAAAQADTETLALTINMSQGPWGRSQFFSPDFLTNPCEPPDRNNTGDYSSSATPDLCEGSRKVSEGFSFVDRNGYWWQGLWCCTDISAENPRNVCSNGAIPVAVAYGRDKETGLPAFFEQTKTCTWTRDNCCAACDDYSATFYGDEDLQKQWSKYVGEEDCQVFPARLNTLCARPYPQ